MSVIVIGAPKDDAAAAALARQRETSAHDPRVQFTHADLKALMQRVRRIDKDKDNEEDYESYMKRLRLGRSDG